MKKSKIEWTDATWNVSTGCTKISPACQNCYAEAMSKRLQGMAKAKMDKSGYKCEVCGFDFVDFNVCLSDDVLYENEVCCAGDEGCLEPHRAFTLPKYAFGFDKVVFYHNALPEILDKKKYPSGSKVFVNSMSDLFHEKLSFGNISKAFVSMFNRQDLIFQVLTKRAENMYDFFYDYKVCLDILFNEDKYPKSKFHHIWLGVTAENQAMADERIPYLLKVKELLGGKVKAFVSVEPMLEKVNLTAYLPKLDWVICGGEKIPNNPKKAREFNAVWLKNLYYQCDDFNVPFFFKQWGSKPNFNEVNQMDSFWTMIEKIKEFPKA